MGNLGKKKMLYEYDPKELDLDSLSELQASLIAKLYLVNQELIDRYTNVSKLGSGLPNSEGAIEALTASAGHLENVNTFLRTELARITNKDDQTTK